MSADDTGIGKIALERVRASTGAIQAATMAVQGPSPAASLEAVKASIRKEFNANENFLRTYGAQLAETDRTTLSQAQLTLGQIIGVNSSAIRSLGERFNLGKEDLPRMPDLNFALVTALVIGLALLLFAAKK